MGALRRWAAIAIGLVVFVAGDRRAQATPAQMVVFLTSAQKVLGDDAPKLSLFGFYYGRTDVSLLGIYAGPRWTFGDVGVELKTGVYGGSGYPVRAIVNNQIDFTRKFVSIAWFSDWYPPDEVYSYLNTSLVFGPLYVGGVADVTYDWSAQHYATFQEGPMIGVGTKQLYFGAAYLFRNDHSEAVRMTIGITL